MRHQEWRKANEEDKKVIKCQRYNLFRNPENRTEKQTLSLKALLKTNENLNHVYVLKETFRHFWTYTYWACADKYLLKWVIWANESKIEQLMKFAKSLLRSKDEILNYCRHQITTGRWKASITPSVESSIVLGVWETWTIYSSNLDRNHKWYPVKVKRNPKYNYY